MALSIIPKFEPILLENAPLLYAPENELGVVYLFSHLAKKWGLKIDSIRAAFPDCIASQSVGGRRKLIRIEFEFKSRNFVQHGHDPHGCDWIVCWEDNWRESKPAHLKIVELRNEFGRGFNVWMIAVSNEYKKRLDAFGAFTQWSVPSQANQGDLLWFYRTAPESCLSDVFLVEGRGLKRKATWRAGDDYMAPIRRLASLSNPVKWEHLRANQMLSSAGFVRAQMQGRHQVTEYWPWLREMVIKRNPSLKKTFAKYRPADLE